MSAHRRTEGEGTVLHPPPLLGYFVKDFTKRVYFSQFSPSVPPPPPFEFLCMPLLIYITADLAMILEQAVIVF